MAPPGPERDPDPLPEALDLLARTRDFLSAYAERARDDEAMPDPETLVEELRRVAAEAESLARGARRGGYSPNAPCDSPPS